MSSEISIDANNDDAANPPPTSTESSSKLGILNEGKVQISSSQTERRSVTFAAPQDIMGERISFSSNNNIDNDGEHKKSVEGIIEYGKAPSDIVDSTRSIDRRK